MTADCAQQRQAPVRWRRWGAYAVAVIVFQIVFGWLLDDPWGVIIVSVPVTLLLAALFSRWSGWQP